jgi:hypothetical protein
MVCEGVKSASCGKVGPQLGFRVGKDAKYPQSVAKKQQYEIENWG